MANAAPGGAEKDRCGSRRVHLYKLRKQCGRGGKSVPGLWRVPTRCRARVLCLRRQDNLEERSLSELQGGALGVQPVLDDLAPCRRRRSRMHLPVSRTRTRCPDHWSWRSLRPIGSCGSGPSVTAAYTTRTATSSFTTPSLLSYSRCSSRSRGTCTSCPSAPCGRRSGRTRRRPPSC